MASPTAALMNKNKAGKPAEAAEVEKEETTTKKAPAKKPAASKSTAKKAAAKAETVQTFDELVSTIENFNKDQAEKALHELLERDGLNDFQLGGALSVIQNNGWWSENYPSFRDYITEEFGLQYRKAIYLVSMYNNLVDAGIEESKIKGVGWTKLKDLAPILTPENVDDWVKKAKELTHIQLLDAIKAYKEQPEDGADMEEMGETQAKAATLTTINFKVHEDQKEVIKQAVAQCREDTETEYDSVAIERICLQYLEAGTGKPKATKLTKANVKAYLAELSVDDAVALLEDAYPDVTISVAL